MKSVFRYGLLPLLAICFVFVRCNKDDHPQWGDDPALFPTGKTMISGVVVDENNQPVSAAVIQFKNQTYFSNENGMFLLPEMEVDADRTYIVCKKDGYFNSARATQTIDGGLTYFIVRLIKKNNTRQFTAAGGVTATIGNGATVQIPASGIINANGQPYSGTVVMSSRYIDPAVRNFSEYMPGGDFEAITTDNRNVELYSFGASEVLLESTAQQRLQLKTGTEAILTFPIAASQLASAPATIPLWYFDEEKGKWIEEGSASKQGNFYVGKVKHFSSWNVDKPLPRAKVHGRVTYCDGTPARGINVSIGGQTAITNHSGDYEVTVFAGERMFGWADYSYDHAMGHVSKDISALAEGERRKVDFTFDCIGALEGTMFNCNGNEVEPGMIVARWATGFATATTDASGKFRLNIPGNTDVIISGVGIDGGILNGMTISTPASGNKKLDTLRLCRQTGSGDGEVVFTLDGGGYNNETITVKSDLAIIPDAAYHRLDDETRLNKTGTNGYGFGAIFEGKDKGSFPEATVFLVYAKQTQGGTTQITFTPVEDKVTFTVTLYGAVGEVIAGTFSGTFVKRTGADPTGVEMQVKNGRFSLRRSADED